MKLDRDWSPGGQLCLVDGYYWGLTRDLQTGMVGKQEEVEKWLKQEDLEHPNNTIGNILRMEMNLR